MISQDFMVRIVAADWQKVRTLKLPEQIVENPVTELL